MQESSRQLVRWSHGDQHCDEFAAYDLAYWIGRRAREPLRRLELESQFLDLRRLQCLPQFCFWQPLHTLHKGWMAH
jgi:hypothetical protein